MAEKHSLIAQNEAGDEINIRAEDGAIRVSGHEGYEAAKLRGDVYSLTSLDANAVTAEYMLYFENKHGTRDFVIHSITIGSIQAGVFALLHASGVATGGTVSTPVNLNGGHADVAPATFRNNNAIAGFTAGGIMAYARTLATGQVNFDLRDLARFPPGSAFAIETDVATLGIVEVTIIGYYD